MQVNWPTLWMSWRERELREIIVLPIIVLIMLVPVGAFSGAAASTPHVRRNTSPSVPSATPFLRLQRPPCSVLPEIQKAGRQTVLHSSDAASMTCNS